MARPEEERVDQLIQETQRRLAPWVRSVPSRLPLFSIWDFTSSYFKLMNFLGGLEGLSPLIAFALLDDDGDGKLNDKERKSFLEVGTAIVDAVIGYLLNIGVVAALLLSIIYPQTLGFIEVTIDALPNARTFQIFAFALYQFTAAACIAMLYVGSRMYVHLAFQLPVLEAKLQYIRSRNKAILFLAWCHMGTLITLPFAILFTTLCITGWWGLFAVVPIMAVFGSWIWDLFACTSNGEELHMLAKRALAKVTSSSSSTTISTTKN